MSDALFFEFAGVSADDYKSVNAILGLDPATGDGAWPAGLRSHTGAAGTGGSFIVFEVWDSQESQAAWMASRLGPVHTGRCEPTTGIEAFSHLVDQVRPPNPTPPPTGCSPVTDNGSSHCGAASIERMQKAWPTVHLVHLPVHASWLDQAEIYFSVVQRRS